MGARLAGAPEQVMVVESPNVPMMSAQNGTLALCQGEHRILVECVVSEDASQAIGKMTYLRLSVL